MQLQDYDYFLQNTDKFYKEHGDSFLAIKDKSILGVYKTFDDALSTTLKKEKIGTFLIQKCLENRDKAVYHFQGNVQAAPLRI